MAEMTAEHQLQIARDVLIEQERAELVEKLRSQDSADIRKEVERLEKSADKEREKTAQEQAEEAKRFNDAVEAEVRRRLAAMPGTF